MAFEETKEQQQIYGMFRSCIYIFLIIELVMNLPIPVTGRFSAFLVELLTRFKVFNSVGTCKVMELVCICIVAIGTKAQKSVKSSWSRMVIYPIAIGSGLVLACFLFHAGRWGGMVMGVAANRFIYAICSVVGTMLIHQGLDAIARYYNSRVGEDRFNHENESFQQSDTLVQNDYSVNIPMLYYWQHKMHPGWINIINPFRGT